MKLMGFHYTERSVMIQARNSLIIQLEELNGAPRHIAIVLNGKLSGKLNVK